MELHGPRSLTTPVATGAVVADTPVVGDCETDTFTVTSPEGRTPPVICGYNTGQHMWVPASDECNMININIDTATTGTNRNWEFKVTQYECNNLAAPTLDCLQYHTAPYGTIASFNYDTNSATAVADTQTHLSHQYYDICIRRASGRCSICYDAHIKSTAVANGASSFGISSGINAAAHQAAVGSECTGTTLAVGKGDYLDIPGLHPPPFLSTTLGVQKICGTWFNAAPGTNVQATACTYANPFKVGVHFDGDDNIILAANAAAMANVAEHGFAAGAAATDVSGAGFQGFWLNYWQEGCTP